MKKLIAKIAVFVGLKVIELIVVILFIAAICSAETIFFVIVGLIAFVWILFMHLPQSLHSHSGMHCEGALLPPPPPPPFPGAPAVGGVVIAEEIEL